MDRFTLRLPDETLEEIEALVEYGGYTSGAEVLREAYRDWKDAHESRVNSARRELEREDPTARIAVDGGERR